MKKESPNVLYYNCPRCVLGTQRLACPLCGGRGEVPWYVMFEEGEINEWDLAYEVNWERITTDEIKERFGEDLAEEIAGKASFLR